MSNPKDPMPPDPDAVALARESAEELSRWLQRRPAAERACLRLDNTNIVLPRQAVQLFRDLLAEMAQSNAVTIVPTYAELTTQQAANILDVSRPHLLTLLENGEIPYSWVGTDRTIRYQDLLAFIARRDEKRQEVLDTLTRDAQDLGMGY